MAKAQFHRNQKVWVASVGTWAVIERIVPIWAKGFDEPVRVTYDVGLGREQVRPMVGMQRPAGARGRGPRRRRGGEAGGRGNVVWGVALASSPQASGEVTSVVGPAHA